MSDVKRDIMSHCEASNLELWNSVCRTDPKMTKDVKYGGREFTAVDPQWQLREATKLWGKFGSTWGMKEVKTKIINVGGTDKTGKSYTDPVVLMKVVFYYPGGQFEIVNDAKFRAGDDTLKKLFTNTRSKALSQLGFSADVFMGEFEDEMYVRRMKNRYEDQESGRAEKIFNAVRSADSVLQLNKCRDGLLMLAAEERVSASDIKKAVDEIKKVDATLAQKSKSEK